MNKQMNAIEASEWTTVIGNGKRMARKWRKQKIQGELDIIDCCGREVTVYAPGFSENGLIVDDDLMRTWLPQWGSKAYYDTSFQPDIEAGCYDLSGGYDSIPYHVGMDEEEYDNY